MKTADKRFEDRVQSSISEKEWNVLTEYMEFLGPIRLSDVEKTQRHIVEKFRSEPERDRFV